MKTIDWRKRLSAIGVLVLLAAAALVCAKLSFTAQDAFGRNRVEGEFTQVAQGEAGDFSFAFLEVRPPEEPPSMQCSIIKRESPLYTPWGVSGRIFLEPSGGPGDEPTVLERRLEDDLWLIWGVIWDPSTQAVLVDGREMTVVQTPDGRRICYALAHSESALDLAIETRREPESDETAVARTAEAYLSAWSRKSYLYTDEDLTAHAVRDEDIQSAAAKVLEAPEEFQASFFSRGAAEDTPEAVGEQLRSDLRFMADKAEYFSSTRQAKGMERTNFELDYVVQTVDIAGDVAVVDILENISFQYPEAPDPSFAQEEHKVALVKLDGAWYVANVTTAYDWFAEQYRDTPYDLDALLAQTAGDQPGTHDLSELAFDAIDPDESPGVGYRIAFESADNMIFYGNFGLFDYDLKKDRMIFGIDFIKAFGEKGSVQGSECTVVQVSPDGQSIVLAFDTSGKYDAYYIDVPTQTYYRGAYAPMEESFSAEDVTGYVKPGARIGDTVYGHNGTERPIVW